jgi:hypothetical protein
MHALSACKLHATAVVQIVLVTRMHKGSELITKNLKPPFSSTERDSSCSYGQLTGVHEQVRQARHTPLRQRNGQAQWPPMTYALSSINGYLILHAALHPVVEISK